MQELRSTDILDKEIQADARKKAEKILAKADADCKAIIDSINDNIANAKSEKEELYAKKLAAAEKDQVASIPLEKERFLVSFVQESIAKNINEYLKTLTEEKRLELVLKNFDTSLVKDKKVTAYVYGFNVKTAEKALSKVLGSSLKDCQETIFGKITQEEDFGLETKEGILIESEDKSFRARLTLCEKVNLILDKYRAELSNVLFGQGAF